MRLFSSLAVSALLVLLVGCSSDGGTSLLEPDNGVTPVDEVVEVAGVPDVVILPDTPVAETLPELVFDSGPDLSGCAPGEGCFLDKCLENSDCLSGWCVNHMGEGVCTVQCEEECPSGWLCQQAAGGPDLTYVCVSNFTNLCRPCSDGNDCKTAVAEDVCVQYGEGENFCGGACAGVDGEGEECPWGFSCKEVQTVAGVTLQQCVADAGACPCTTQSVALGLFTPCKSENEWGTCSGIRVCEDAGLSDCDAATPAMETCNGQDDNCDGQVDEPVAVEGEYLNLCDDANPCTDDGCMGADGCEHLPLSGTECIDGNPCTIADNCQDGVCAGTAVDCDDENPCTDDGCDEEGGCLFNANTLPCDDGEVCTVADQCAGGECTGFPVDCQCQADEDCAQLEDGDVCNGTLFCDTGKFPYLCQVKPDTTVVCPLPQGADAPCLAATCEPATGECGFSPKEGLIACDDGDTCTINDVCADGACAGGPQANCFDGNPCTADMCDPATGCYHEDVEGQCDDGNACTTGDQCSEGVCAATGLVDCDDGNACTKDSCQLDGQCLNAAIDGSCSDGDPCTANDFCQEGLCVPGPALLCNDGNPCTNDSCSPVAGCLHEPAQLPCTDGNECTTGDHCEGGECTHDALLDCDDGNVCTSDGCDPVNGCVHTLNDSPCDDGDVCTTGDHCHLGGCISSSELTCDDSNPCTDDSCSPATGCLFQPNTIPCDDGNECTYDDACNGGVCQGGGWDDCDDGNPCTEDSCNGLIGCVHMNNALECDDGDACTAGEFCSGGLCGGGGPVVCNDGNVCTDDTCHPGAGCIYPNNSVPCDDDEVCTQGDVCQDGECTSGEPVVCNDNVGCTVDVCIPGGGCDYTPDNSACADGNECTSDLCDLANGCSNPPVANQTPCGQEGWKCVDGQCVESQPCDGGWIYKGRCWYQGPVMTNGYCPTCDEICSGHGGCHAPLLAEGWDQSCTACKATGCPNCGCQDGPGNVAAHEAAPMHNGSTCEYTDHPNYPPICGKNHCNSTVWGRYRLCPCNETP